MSIIAWDGTTVAADRQGNRHDLRTLSPKLHPVDGLVLGVVGTVETGHRMVQWYAAGADPDEWPKGISENEWDGTLLLVFGSDGVRSYCQYPVYDTVQDGFTAWGSGRDYAIGAMAMGADAVKAVEVASQFNVYCGMGVDAYAVADLRTLDKPKAKRSRAKRRDK